MSNRKAPFLAYRSFYTPLNTIEQFAKAGYETICVFPAHTVNSRGTPYSQYPPVWRWYDKLDYAPFDNMIEDITRAAQAPHSAISSCEETPSGEKEEAKKETKFLLMIDLNSPAWLEHMNCYSCSDTFNHLGKAVHNSQWLEPTKTYLEAFVRYAHQRYGDRIAAYILACGATDEWYDYSEGTEDKNRRAAWRKYQLAHGRPDPIDIPPISVREHMTHEDFLRSPDQDMLALQYWKFCNESIADTILNFAGITRGIVGDQAQIGCFYGYILEKSHHTLVSCGHLEYERVLDSPDIDFLISPGTYTDRQIGGGSGFLIPNGTAAVRGKHLLHECDQRTHTSNTYLTPYINLRMASAWPNEKATVAGIKREACLGLVKRAHLWWFDMWGDFYQGEQVMDTMARVRALWEEYAAFPAQDRCQVALIVDPDSTYMVNQDHPFAGAMNLGVRNRLNRLGAPFEVYSFGDIPSIENFEQYRLVIFTSLFHITQEKQEILERFVLRDNRHVLFLYAPGIWTGDHFGTENCEKLCGIPYGAEGLCVQSMPGWTSCYLHRYSDVTPEMLRELAQQSGVCLTADAPVPVYAEGDLLAVHHGEGGPLSLRVDPQYRTARELFTGKICAVEQGTFSYEMDAPDTALFLLQR